MDELEELTIEKGSLYCPPLDELACVLQDGLKNCFKEVCVKVVDCPDLTLDPFNMCCKGIGGQKALVEVGGPPYLLPLVNKAKVYNLTTLCKRLKFNPCFALGAGAGPWPYAGQNCESLFSELIIKNWDELRFGLRIKMNPSDLPPKVGLIDEYYKKTCEGIILVCPQSIRTWIANTYLHNDSVLINKSNIAKIKDNGKDFIQEKLPTTETRFALLANLMFCQGIQDKVLKVSCRKRIGEDDFPTSIRNTLRNKYDAQPIGLGGTFLLHKGKAKMHVMPPFSTDPIESDEQVNQWLKFFEMSSPLVAVGTLVSTDVPGLDLRVQHFHASSSHGDAGHYHYDTTPDEAEYLGFFSLADTIFRVDKPQNTHQIGRD